MKAMSTPRLNRLTVILVMMELALVLFYWIYILCGEPRSLGSVFDLDGEANLHSWFSSAQLLVIGLGFYCATLFQTERRPSRLFMSLMAGAAILLSVDET